MYPLLLSCGPKSSLGPSLMVVRVKERSELLCHVINIMGFDFTKWLWERISKEDLDGIVHVSAADKHHTLTQMQTLTMGNGSHGFAVGVEDLSGLPVPCKPVAFGSGVAGSEMRGWLHPGGTPAVAFCISFQVHSSALQHVSYKPGIPAEEAQQAF